jgi:DNA-binding response OmpR family regulator
MLAGTPELPPKVPLSEPPRTTRRVRVIDDNRGSAESLAILIQLAGHETRVAYDGFTAVEAAATFGPEMVLLDIGLPDLNGFDTARRIREQPWGKKIVLVALTGWGQ